ncbi:MAG TPA: M14 family metallopeptidase, partial [Bacillota bacterium]|nr:M14 family metallopeptidase [Bacillota bacterium]
MDYDRYLNYEELTTQLQEWVQSYPELAQLTSAGKSYEGRDIWALTISGGKEPAPDQKPAMYIEGNIHAGEVTASMVCLYTAQHLLDNYGSNDEVTHLLDTRTYYILPRVNPDGAEKYLTTPYTLRSSVKPYPDVETSSLPGLHPSDINGDGHILMMRVRDDKRGEWTVSKKDPRIMIRRTPGARGGPFYRIYPEGSIHEFEGEPFDVIRTPWGLDLNRNFPSNWDRSFVPGGTFPTSEPEVKAVVEFIVNHKNIGCLQSFHTSGGFFFRNP